MLLAVVTQYTMFFDCFESRCSISTSNSFSLSVCRVRRIVEIVDSYLCDYVCLIISLILYRLDYLRNHFIKNAICSNILINRLNFCYLSISELYLAVRTILKTV